MTPNEAAEAVWTAHALVMNGGVLHCADALSKRELTDAIIGYRLFGLADVAQILAVAAKVVANEADEAERRLDEAYNRAIPDDGFLSSQIEKAFAAERTAPDPHLVGQRSIESAIEQFVQASSEAERLSGVPGKTREQHRAHDRTEAAIGLLLRQWSAGGHEALRGLLHHRDGAVRAAAATYLAISDPDVAIPVLEQLEGAGAPGSLTAFGTLFAIRHKRFPDPLVRLSSRA